MPLRGDLGAYTVTDSGSGGSTSGTSGGDETTGDETAGDSTGLAEFPGCLPGNPELEVKLEIDAPTLSDPEAYPNEFDVRCTVQSAEGGELVLQCTDDLEGIHAVTLSVTTPTPKAGLLGGETEVRLHYRDADAQEFGLDIRTHVALHAVDDGELLLFYGQGLNVLEAEFADFWAPLELEESELGACPAVLDELTECETRERYGVQVGIGPMRALVFDSSVAAFPPQSLWFYVEQAVDVALTGSDDCFDFVGGRSVEVLALKADI